MSIDMQNFDLFNKKKNPIAPKPVVVTPTIIENPIIEEDEGIEIDLSPVHSDLVNEPVLEVSKPQVRVSEYKELATDENKTAKYETFLPLTARIVESQVMELKKLENQIMRSRSKSSKNDRERITVNTIMRCMISNFLERAGDLDLSSIDNEEILKERMEKAFKQKYRKN